MIPAPVSDVVSLVEQIVFELPNTFLILDICLQRPLDSIEWGLEQEKVLQKVQATCRVLCHLNRCIQRLFICSQPPRHEIITEKQY